MTSYNSFTSLVLVFGLTAIQCSSFVDERTRPPRACAPKGFSQLSSDDFTLPYIFDSQCDIGIKILNLQALRAGRELHSQGSRTMRSSTRWGCCAKHCSWYAVSGLHVTVRRGRLSMYLYALEISLYASICRRSNETLLLILYT
jgi:hypothetical protein